MGKINNLFTQHQIVWIIIVFGTICRLSQYIFNRSLWIDEAALALKVINYSYVQLFNPFIHPSEPFFVQFQMAPLGFLFLVKFLVQIFGDHEYVLRFFPLVFGISSLFLFRNFAREFLNDRAALFALGIFALSFPLIIYSSEFKPYSCDVLMTLLLYFMFRVFYTHDLTFKHVIVFGFAGAVAVWFSFPATIVLINGIIFMFFLMVFHKNWIKLSYFVGMAFIWTASFIVYYLMYLQDFLEQSQWLDFWWKNFYFRFFPISDFTAFFTMMFVNPVGLYFKYLTAAFFIGGCVLIFLKRRDHFLLLIGPLILTWIFSAFHKYPFYGRLIHFLVPCLIVFIAEGMDHMVKMTKGKQSVISIMILSLLYIPSGALATHRIFKPYTRENIKPVLSKMNELRKDNDVISMHPDARYALRYYAKRFDLGNHKTLNVYQINNIDLFLNDFHNMKDKKRVWIIFSHINDTEKSSILSSLNEAGNNLYHYQTHRASAYLYTFN